MYSNFFWQKCKIQKHLSASSYQKCKITWAPPARRSSPEWFAGTPVRTRSPCNVFLSIRFVSEEKNLINSWSSRSVRLTCGPLQAPSPEAQPEAWTWVCPREDLRTGGRGTLPQVQVRDHPAPEPCLALCLAWCEQLGCCAHSHSCWSRAPGSTEWSP